MCRPFSTWLQPAPPAPPLTSSSLCVDSLDTPCRLPSQHWSCCYNGLFACQSPPVGSQGSRSPEHNTVPGSKPLVNLKVRSVAKWKEGHLQARSVLWGSLNIPCMFSLLKLFPLTEIVSSSSSTLSTIPLSSKPGSLITPSQWFSTDLFPTCRELAPTSLSFHSTFFHASMGEFFTRIYSHICFSHYWTPPEQGETGHRI